VGFTLGVTIPFVLESNSTMWFKTQTGLLITINYTIFVPALLAAYINLNRTSYNFFSADGLRDLNLEKKKTFQKKNYRRIFKLSQIFIAVLSVIIIFFAVDSIIKTECDNKSPWVQYESKNGGGKCESASKSHSTSGILYYSFRGINTQAALGLISLATGIFFVLLFFFR
jgi:hypothetical protein